MAQSPMKRLRRSAWFDGRDYYLNRVVYEEAGDSGRMSLAELATPGVTSCFLTSLMQDDDEWLLRNFGHVPEVVVVASAPRDEKGSAVGEATLIEACFPSRPSWKRVLVRPKSGIMHAKLYLLRLCDRLRVVISSSNLGHQWDLVRESFWVQDFPLTEGATPTKEGAAFAAKLRAFCAHVTAPHEDAAGFAPLLDGVDFGGVNARLVESVPGRAWKSAFGPSGYRGLATTLQETLAAAPWPKAGPAATILSYSGSIGDFGGANGDSPVFLRGMELALTETRLGFDPSTVKTATWDEVQALRILFPTNLTALSTSLQMLTVTRGMTPAKLGAVPAEARARLLFDARPTGFRGLALGATPAWFNEPARLSDDHLELFLDKSWRPPLAHAKVILRTVQAVTDGASAQQEPAPVGSSSSSSSSSSGGGGGGGGGGSDDDAPAASAATAAWVYVGSHNLSRAAWGVKAQQPNNIELGVLLSTPSLARAAEWHRRLPVLPPQPGAPGYADLSAKGKMYGFGGRLYAGLAACTSQAKADAWKEKWHEQLLRAARKHRPAAPERSAAAIAALLADFGEY